MSSERDTEIMHKGANASSVVTLLTPPALPHDMPAQIAGYMIERVIGSGGMGTVYAAGQQKPRRTVALKVMRPGIASPTALRRFEFEAQILVHLRHPGIAQIHEAGTFQHNGTELPFFVMEFLSDAVTLTQFAEKHHLKTPARLELFCAICDAVHYGHQKGVIHRDLKPSNVLVDSSGAIKIIDFGVARSIDSDLAATTMQTEAGQLIGTLQYMSPEQVSAQKTIVFRGNLAKIYLELGRDAEALSIQRDVAADARAVFGDAPRLVAPHLADYGLTLARLNDPQAKAVLQEAFPGLKEAGPAIKDQCDKVASALAAALEREGDSARAAEWRAKLGSVDRDAK